MIIITWKGIFERLGQKASITLDFVGDDLKDLNGQIREYVETREDNGFELVYNEILEVREV